MVHYKKSAAAAAVASAGMASAQNNTIFNTNNVNIQVNNFNFDYTTVIPQLCPTGWQDQTYTIHQACPTECGQPDIPLGWEVVTTECNYFGPEPTVVTWTSCPYLEATAQPEPHQICDECHLNVVEYCPPVPKDCDTCTPSVVTCATVISTPVTCPTPPPGYNEQPEEDCEEEAPIAPPPTTAGEECDEACQAAKPAGGEASSPPPPATECDEACQAAQKPASEGGPTGPTGPTYCNPHGPGCENNTEEASPPPAQPYTAGADKAVACAATFLVACAIGIAGLL